MEFTSKRVIVVGAGVAGLSAGRELLGGGFQPVVLEARERIGGRILTFRDAGIPVEAGAEFVHGRHAALWEVLRSVGAAVSEVPEGGGSWDEMDRVFAAMAGAPEQSFAEFIRDVEAPEQVKQAATGFVEGFNAAHKERVSVAWLNSENAAADEIEGGRSFRVSGGYELVPEHLGKGLDIRLHRAVRRIRWRRGEVVAETDGGDFRAARAVITVPMAVLLEDGLTIEPEPVVLRRAREAIGIGQAMRVTFRFRDVIAQTGFLHGEEPFPVCWTNGALVTAWAAGPKADALAGRGSEEVKRIALGSIRGILEEDPGKPESIGWFHDWRSDPLSRMAYSYVRVGGMAAQRALSEPVEDTLYFAGEACAPAGHIGTVHGAIASGKLHRFFDRQDGGVGGIPIL